MKLKICDITQSYTTRSGGIRTYIETKRKHILENTNWEHVLIIPGEKDHRDCYDRLVTHRVASPKIPGCEPYRFIYRLDKVLSILKQEKPDIIELGSGYILPWAAFKFRKRHLTTVIGFYHTDFPNAYVKTHITRLTNNKIANHSESIAYRYVKMIYGRCDGTIVSSTTLKQKLEQCGVHNVKTIPLGVDFELFSRATASQDLRQRILGRNAEHILIYVGRFDREKRPDFLIDAYQQIPQKEKFSLVLVGDGPLRKTIMAKAAREKNIFVLPYQAEKRKLATILASADIYVTAGAYETFGLSVLEAQACGLPVVGVKAGALIERVQDSFGALTDVNSPRDMAINIHKLSQNGLLQRGKNAMVHVKNNYTWAVFFKRLFQYYQSAY